MKKDSLQEESTMYTIKEVCKKTGLTAHTLRYYEKEGLLTDIGRSQGGFLSTQMKIWSGSA